jgi:hypothetical protein
MRCPPLDISKDRQPAPASEEWRSGGGPAHVGDHHRPSRLQALVAGMRRARRRRGVGFVVDQHGGEMVGVRSPHAVEQREPPVRMAQGAQEGKRAVDCPHQRPRRLQAAAGVELPEGEKIEQELEEQPRVPAHRAAVGKDLGVELAREDPRGAPQQRAVTLAGETGEGERDRRDQAAVRPGGPGRVALQLPDRPPHRAQEAVVEGVVRPVQEKGRLAEIRDQPPGEDRGLAGEAPVAVAFELQLVDEGAGMGGGERRVGGAQVAQPAEAEQDLAPGPRRQPELEGRAAARGERPAREDEGAGVKVRRHRRVGGAQVLRGE